jgi:cytochrome c oxidase accessory protein FixG
MKSAEQTAAGNTGNDGGDQGKEQDNKDSGLYQSWQKIYPKYQPGFFRIVKWTILAIALGIYYLLPALRWDRGEGLPDQAVLFDLPGRKFYLFDLVVWPQEVFLLTFLLIAAAVALFFVTALAGRVFCGYFCFQTVWTDMFLFVEHLLEGSPRQRRALDRGPWTGRKISVKLVKHALWIFISFATGGAFVAYFVDSHVLLRGMIDGSASETAWFVILMLTASTYTMAGFAREQVCIYMCPYARFQGAMFDPDTLVIAYDETRGEPRESNRRKREGTSPTGHCIDCDECVRVCPTGIDIRDGQQYQCITCAACIDACDAVMDRAKLPRGLVRYTSLRALSAIRDGGRPISTLAHLLRFRVLVYTVLLAAAIGSMSWYINHRELVEINVLRQRQPIFVRLSDGGIQNNYTLRLLNMTSTPHDYLLRVDGLPGVDLMVAAADRLEDGKAFRLHAGPGQVIPYNVYLRKQPTDDKLSGTQPVRFDIRAVDSAGGTATYESVFFLPHGNE